MKRLLLAVGDGREVGAGAELLPCRIHLAAKLPFENDAIVRHPLGEGCGYRRGPETGA